MTMIRVFEAGSVWPYSLSQLRADEPERSFSSAPSDRDLAHYGVFRVVPAPRPAVDPAAEKAIETTPELVDGVWLQQWVIEELSDAERYAYWRAQNPPRWVEFAGALQVEPGIRALLAAGLQAAPELALALPAGLLRAADGDARVFLGAWGAARGGGLISDELVARVQELGEAHHLPEAFVAALGGGWKFPESGVRFERWTAPDGSVWVWDQPRGPNGQYLADDPETEEVESALQWLPVGGEA